MMPVAEEIGVSPSSDFRYAYASHFTHDKEQARAGRYGVELDSGVSVDLSASLHTGSELIRFPEGKAANVLIRTSDSEAGSTDAHTVVDVSHRTMSGSVTSGNFCGYIDKADRRSYYAVYFVAEFDQPFAKPGARQVTPGGTKADGGSGFGAKGFPDKGHGSGVWVGFDATNARQVLVRVGVSSVSAANARENLAAENPSASAQIGDNNGTQFSVNGLRPNLNSCYLDGSYDNEFQRGGGNIMPNSDAVQEFRLLTINFDAEFGRYPGGVVNVMTRSGTNQYHGVAYD
jgi:putative alpha-1,2-mannosidase